MSPATRGGSQKEAHGGHLALERARMIGAVSAELDDILETFHYRFVVEQLPLAGMAGLVQLLGAVPGWLEEILEAQPILATSTGIDEHWRAAAGALETAGERLFRRIEATT